MCSFAHGSAVAYRIEVALRGLTCSAKLISTFTCSAASTIIKAISAGTSPEPSHELLLWTVTCTCILQSRVALRKGVVQGAATHLYKHARDWPTAKYYQGIVLSGG